MKPITEERQQELIEYIKSVLSAHIQRGGDSDEEDVFKIALASLTAEPVVWEIAGCIFSTEAEALKPGFRGTPEPLYEYPPIPVINFPNPHDIPDGYDLDSCMATVQWYQSEVKRLNGLEQS